MIKLRTLIYQFLGIDLILIERDKVLEFLTEQNEILRLENDQLRIKLERSLVPDNSPAPDLRIAGRESWGSIARKFEASGLQIRAAREREKKEREVTKSS